MHTDCITWRKVLTVVMEYLICVFVPIHNKTRQEYTLNLHSAQCTQHTITYERHWLTEMNTYFNDSLKKLSYGDRAELAKKKNINWILTRRYHAEMNTWMMFFWWPNRKEYFAKLCKNQTKIKWVWVYACTVYIYLVYIYIYGACS